MTQSKRDKEYEAERGQQLTVVSCIRATIDYVLKHERLEPEYRKALLWIGQRVNTRLRASQSREAILERAKIRIEASNKKVHVRIDIPNRSVSMGNNNASSDLPNPANPNNKSGFSQGAFKIPVAPKTGVLPSAKSADPHAKQTTGS